ncbi:MAG: hypothetical protein V4438_01320 [Patescibacteria group bacterium]
MKTAPFVIVICYTAPSVPTVWGKIGPFDSEIEAARWSGVFRNKARIQSLDMISFTSNDLAEITGISPELEVRDYLPSKDHDEVIRNASVQFLIPR